MLVMTIFDQIELRRRTPNLFSFGSLDRDYVRRECGDCLDTI